MCAPAAKDLALARSVITTLASMTFYSSKEVPITSYSNSDI
jgi:hypothetical protein